MKNNLISNNTYCSIIAVKKEKELVEIETVSTEDFLKGRNTAATYPTDEHFQI